MVIARTVRCGLLATLLSISGGVLAHARDASTATATLGEPRADVGVAALGTQVVFAGGTRADPSSGASDVVDLYDVSTDQWTTGHLSEPRSRVAVATAGGKVLMAGGATSAGRLSGTVDVLDTATGEWTSDALPRVRQVSVAATVGSSVVFLGDASDLPGGLPRVVLADIYDGATGQWSAADPPLIGPNGVSGAVVGSRLLVTGFRVECGEHGFQGCRRIPTRDVAIYDSETGQWSSAQRRQPTVSGIAVTVGTQVVFAGGAIDDVYDADTSRWTTVVAPHGTVQQAIAADHRAVFLGHSAADSESDHVFLDVYDTSNGTWISRTVPGQHKNPSLTAGNGRVMVIGEREDFRVSDRVETYDIASDLWASTTLSVPRVHTAVISVAGWTLVAGGIGGFQGSAPPSDVVDILATDG